MIGVGVIAIRLYITGWTRLKMDLMVPQVFKQRRIFDTTYAVAET